MIIDSIEHEVRTFTYGMGLRMKWSIVLNKVLEPTNSLCYINFNLKEIFLYKTIDMNLHECLLKVGGCPRQSRKFELET